MDNPPNILFLLPDQWRPDWLGFLGGVDIDTPNIDKLAHNGTYFPHAISPSPLCAPARACLASGRDYYNCGVLNNQYDYPLDQPTYYQSLRDAGYEVTGVGKFDLHKNLSKPLDWSLDGSRCLKEWGFTKGIDNEGKIDAVNSYLEEMSPKGPYMKHLEDQGVAMSHCEGMKNRTLVTELSDDSYCDNWITNNGIRLLQGFEENKPWHIVFNFTGPHSPFDVTQEMHDSVCNRKYDLPVNCIEKDLPRDWHKRKQYYAAMIENLDKQIGRIIAVVEDRGELDNTLIVFASDHGDMMGDFNRYAKGRWNHASMGIPLIVSGRGVISGKTVNHVVSLHDLGVSFLDCANIAPLKDVDAQSIRPLWEGKTNNELGYRTSHLKDHKYKWDSIYDGRYKYVMEANGFEGLYDRKTDPNEINNLIHESGIQNIRLEMRTHLENKIDIN